MRIAVQLLHTYVGIYVGALTDDSYFAVPGYAAAKYGAESALKAN